MNTNDTTWLYNKIRRSDLEQHDEHDLWPAYCVEAAGYEPMTAPTFTAWIEARVDGEVV